MSTSSTSFLNYDLIRSFKVPDSEIEIQKWKSRKTGLAVVWANYKAPIVAGTFTVPTEIFDDTGRPHTLEHLVFLGSKTYPYKGILDNLANRSFADGTNAWTDTDNTSYTISTAGYEGFLRILPVYIDHILYPTLTKEGFVTEVHHINPLAEDAGVVYAEMQARENQSGDLMALKMQRLLYPQSSAYRSETGGLMSALRTLTVEQIREYHGSLYVPHNLTLQISGSVPLHELLTVLSNDVDATILSRSPPYPPPSTEWKRPFVETSSNKPLEIAKGEVKETVLFMEKDESVGEVQIAFAAGIQRRDWLSLLAIDVLTTYLTDSAVAPLNKIFVEIASPLATSIDIYTANRVVNDELTIYASDVPFEELDTIGDQIKKSLKDIVTEGVDMKRMTMVLGREKRQTLFNLETRPENMISNSVVADILYGDVGATDLENSFSTMKYYSQLETWTSADWSKFLEQTMVTAPSITVIGKPSSALADKIETDEKARIAAQKKALGEAGLAKLEKELEDAKAFNDRDIPKDVLENFEIPSVKSITWIPVDTAVNDPLSDEQQKAGGAVQKHVDSDGDALPYYVHFSSVESNFLTLDVFFSSASLPAHLRPYAIVWAESVFSLPITRVDGTKLSHEEVINQLNDETVEYFSDFGSGGAFGELLRVQIKAESSAYENSIAWFRDILWNSDFAIERLEVVVAKLVQELPQRKRDGDAVARAAADSLLFDESKSTAASVGLLPQISFLHSLVEKLKESPELVVKDLEEFRHIVTKPENIRIAVSGNILKIPTPRSSWSKSFRKLPKSQLSPVAWSKDGLSSLGKTPSKECVLVALPSIEGSYSVHTAKGVVGWDHPDLPALEVTKSMLNALESYLWKYIRGAGLAYGAGTTTDYEAGFVGFYVYKSPDCFKAFKEAARVLGGLADGTIELDDSTLDASKSSLVFSYARKEKSLAAAAGSAFTNEALKKIPLKFGQEVLSRIQEVTKEQVLSCLQTYFLPIFQHEHSILALACSTAKADEIEKGFSDFGYSVERRALPSSANDEDESMDGSGSEYDSDSEMSGSEASR